MSWSSGAAFLVCLLKRKESVKKEALNWCSRFQDTIRDMGGTIVIRVDRSHLWDVVDGRDHHIEPDHLHPAIFDMNGIILASFPTHGDVLRWWTSDAMFELIKWRTEIEKIGLFSTDSLRSFEDSNPERAQACYGDRILLLELMKMYAFKPVQSYVDNYKKCAEQAPNEIGIRCNLMVSEGITDTFMSEFPLDALCISGWRSKADAGEWCDSPAYTNQLLPDRVHAARCLSMMIPHNEAVVEAKIMKERHSEEMTKAALR